MEKSKTKVDAFVISDDEGNYFVVPREHLELSKVRGDAKREVDKLMKTRKSDPINLGGGFSFIGVMRLPDEMKWTYYSPDIAWPH